MPLRCQKPDDLTDTNNLISVSPYSSSVTLGKQLAAEGDRLFAFDLKIPINYSVHTAPSRS